MVTNSVIVENITGMGLSDMKSFMHKKSNLSGGYIADTLISYDKRIEYIKGHGGIKTMVLSFSIVTDREPKV